MALLGALLAGAALAQPAPTAGPDPSLAINEISCSEFVSDSPNLQGPVLLRNGLTLFECSEEFSVACCAPVAVPVSPSQ